MSDYLVFTLVAPMGAFGDLAGHEWRGSHRWPGRSALMGLIGGALGIRRDNRDGQEALSVWKTAVSVLQDGDVWQDFHTVQTVSLTRIKQPPTRRAALAALQPSDNGLVTRREYRSNCVFGVALWNGDIPPLEKALRRPVFTPYLGRKSCPLSAPMHPQVVVEENVGAALTQIKLPPFLPDLRPEHIEMVASDEEIEQGRVETRWDDPLDRNFWHFGKRKVYIYRPESGA